MSYLWSRDHGDETFNLNERVDSMIASHPRGSEESGHTRGDHAISYHIISILVHSTRVRLL